MGRWVEIAGAYGAVETNDKTYADAKPDFVSYLLTRFHVFKMWVRIYVN